MTGSPNPVATCGDVRRNPVDLLILLGVTGIEVSQSAASAFRIHPTLRYVVGVADCKDRCSLRANGEVANLEDAAFSFVGRAPARNDVAAAGSSGGVPMTEA